MLIIVQPVIKASIFIADLVILVAFIQIIQDVQLVIHHPYVHNVNLDIIYKTTIVMLALLDAQPVYLQMFYQIILIFRTMSAKLAPLVTF
jgi:hypothetical protein